MSVKRLFSFIIIFGVGAGYGVFSAIGLLGLGFNSTEIFTRDGFIEAFTASQGAVLVPVVICFPAIIVYQVLTMMGVKGGFDKLMLWTSLMTGSMALLFFPLINKFFKK